MLQMKLLAPFPPAMAQTQLECMARPAYMAALKQPSEVGLAGDLPRVGSAVEIASGGMESDREEF